ncbi:unnamed protein product, partial [Urochloa humidicola]
MFCTCFRFKFWLTLTLVMIEYCKHSDGKTLRSQDIRMRSALTLIAELKLVDKYNLKCKRELWRVQYAKSCIRNAARVSKVRRTTMTSLVRFRTSLIVCLLSLLKTSLSAASRPSSLRMAWPCPRAMFVAYLGNATSDLYINNDSNAIIEQTGRTDNKAIN